MKIRLRNIAATLFFYLLLFGKSKTKTFITRRYRHKTQKEMNSFYVLITIIGNIKKSIDFHGIKAKAFIPCSIDLFIVLLRTLRHSLQHKLLNF